MIEKQCPKCGKFATGKKDVENKFGFRGDLAQSYCRDCRTKHGAKMEKIKSNMKKQVDFRTKDAKKKLKRYRKK